MGVNMAVHASGDGASWPEDLDADQPHGLDYRQFNHITIGVRKRIGQEHATFADSTVGGIHKPGGSAVLGMDITDDCTAGGLTTEDGTYRGHGLVWSYSDTSNYGVLWCSSSAAGLTDHGGDFTVVKMHPDLQWGSGDVTWVGAHAFQGNVDMSDVDITGTLDVSGDTGITGDLSVTGDVSITGAAYVDSSLDCSDFAATGTMSIDGTETHNDEADFSAVNIDGTSSILVACTSQSNGAVDMSSAVTYKVDTDGRIDVNGSTSAANGYMRLHVGSADPPSKILSETQKSGNGHLAHIDGLIPQNYFWEVSATNMTIVSILWTAAGKGACVSQA
jgi:hypothetical protein